MGKNIKILTQGSCSPNAWAFLYPLIRFKDQLRDIGYNITITNNKYKAINDNDVIILDSKFYSSLWENHTDRAIQNIKYLKKYTSYLIYADITDSTSWDHAKALPYVDVYMKNQIFIDKSNYLKSFYGNRIYTDYYHTKYNIIDGVEQNFSSPAQQKKDLAKIILGWNSSMADWSLYGPLKLKLYNITNWNFLCKNMPKISRHNMTKATSLYMKFNSYYKKNTVGYQRQKIGELLKKYGDTRKIKRKKYFRELSRSKVVVSPFGLGEITLKDFEVFLTGGLLLKPQMDHMITWPPLFEDNVTMVTHNWDLSNLDERVEDLISNYEDYLHIAYEGQKRYSKYCLEESSKELFCTHFTSIIENKKISKL